MGVGTASGTGAEVLVTRVGESSGRATDEMPVDLVPAPGAGTDALELTAALMLVLDVAFADALASAAAAGGRSASALTVSGPGCCC